MLSANLGNVPQLELPSQPDLAPAVISSVISQSVIDNSLGARDQALAISAVHLLIDGREVTLTSLDRPLEMKVGSSLQIVGIDYRLHGEEGVSGKIAFEGYLNKLHGRRIRTDYSDGRFGGHVQEGELPFSSSSHPGLNDAWKMEAGTESLTLVMVRYDANGATVEDRITIRTQVGTPDFVIDPEIKIKGSSKGVVVGRRVNISGSWGNQGEGRYRNYAEVNIYHESDPEKIVWAGTIADVVDAGEFDKGRFVNRVRRDGFSRSWIPELGGTYVLKFYADPENQWNESNESNNVVTVKLEVKDLRQSPRGRDTSRGFRVNPHSVNDSTAHDMALALAASELNAGQTNLNEVETIASENSTEEANTETVEAILAAPLLSSISVAIQADVSFSEKDSDIVDEDEWLKAIDAVLTMPEFL